MAGVSRAYQDTAGGTILSGASSVNVNGLPVALMFSPVAGHGKNRHSGPQMIRSSHSVRANGRGVVRQGDSATCGHPATGSGNVFAGD
tara:strand:- start:367 stop:630 length:264 start_codon:yes stop_codon:yes gene_type:complete